MILYDLIYSNIYKKQRGSPLKILFRSLFIGIINLNLPSKISLFLYYTLTCLFGEQHQIALQIPIINIRNLDDSIKRVLSIDQKCYVTRRPLFLRYHEFESDLRNLPKEYLETLGQAVNRLSPLYKIGDERLSKLKEKLEIQLEKNPLSEYIIIYGIAENGTLLYAIIEGPQPERTTRIISRLWCTDPYIKEAILAEIQKKELMEVMSQ